MQNVEGLYMKLDLIQTKDAHACLCRAENKKITKNIHDTLNYLKNFLKKIKTLVVLN